MGQAIAINKTAVMGEVLLVDTDRSLTGQDSHVVTPDQPGEGVPRKLGEEVFALGLGIDHVHVLQNQVALRRPGGWDDDAMSQVQTAIQGFLLFY